MRVLRVEHLRNGTAAPGSTIVEQLRDLGEKVYSTAASWTVWITATRSWCAVDVAVGPELPVTLPGAAGPPVDRVIDGAFENFSGDLRREFADGVSHFNNLDRNAANEPAARFDLHFNDRIGVADVVRLFQQPLISFSLFGWGDTPTEAEAETERLVRVHSGHMQSIHFSM